MCTIALLLLLECVDTIISHRVKCVKQYFITSMSLRGIKLITFDATNTILKFRVPPWEHYANVARQHGFKGSSLDIKDKLLSSYKKTWEQHPNFGKGTIYWKDWWRRVVISTFQDELPVSTDMISLADRLIQEFSTSQCWYAAEGVEKLLQDMNKLNITLGIISNFDPRLNNILKDFNLLHSFNFVINSYDIGYCKPNKKVFDYALDEAAHHRNEKIMPSEALHMGDNVENDYKAPRAAGWHALIINENLKSETPPAPAYVFNNLIELRLSIRNQKLRL